MVLVFNLPSKKSDFKAPRFHANIVFVSQEHKDYNGFEDVPSKEKGGQPFLINTPGEYEIGGVTVKGIGASNSNTIFVVNLENISLCHLGPFNEKELGLEARELLSNVDVLFAPADGEMLKTINQIEPKIIIPAYTEGKQLKSFLESLSQEKTAPVEKLTFKKKDISNKKEEVIVLKSLIN